MRIACLVVVAPASWAGRAGSDAEAGAEVPFVALVPVMALPGITRKCGCPLLAHLGSASSDD